MGGGMGMPGMGGMQMSGGMPGMQMPGQIAPNPFAMNTQTTPTTPSVPPEELYATQLEQLREMGFYSPAENIRALQMSGGNVQAAVEILFSKPPGATF
jgi:ubiquilin